MSPVSVDGEQEETIDESNRRSVFRFVLSVAIAVIFIAFVEWYLGWAVLLRPWSTVEWHWLALGVILYLLTHFFRALRLHDYFRESVRGHLLACLGLVLRHNLFNNLLPMRSGEAAFPVLMSRTFGIPLGRSLPGLLWFRLLDLHSLILLAAPLLLTQMHWGGVVILTALWLMLPPMASRLATRFGPQERSGGALVRRIIIAALGSVPRDRSIFWRTQLWTLANWSLKLAVLGWILVLFVPLPPQMAVLGAIGGELSSVLPLHGIAGLGTYEAGVTAMLAVSDLTPKQLVNGAVNLHLFILGVTLLGGGIALMLPSRRSIRANVDTNFGK